MYDQEVANDIIQAVMAQGELARRDALQFYGLEVEELDRIKQLVVSHDQIQLDRSTFRLRPTTDVAPKDAASTCVSFEQIWKNTGAYRLRELLRHDELEQLVGHLAYTIRQSRALRTGISRRGCSDYHFRDMVRDSGNSSAIGDGDICLRP